ncbi:YcxB-like protein [Cardinium endosymbiont of Sogatella furcifera]|uniref:YcxB family protein n=1 Tax=Cardinium endosymbiont of Sogatella furcifera TaxID=650378 RepID=UPI000E0CF3C8|nr:YcxB family protein [Cardinium endosymbiont of Sogatella furcifera]AXI24048.1 YcxB-like protein [Cardinium endosymbiont of Sogatella furcifera]
MIVKTKKYKMSNGLYVKLGIQNILRMQWWIFPLLALLMSSTFFIKTIWFVLVGIIGFICYLIFWLVQLYGLTQLDTNRPIFERVVYEINNQQLIMQLNAKQAMPISWTEIRKAYKGKGYFLLVLSKVQFFYLPFKIFHGDNEIKFFTTVLQRKGLLK